VVPPVKHLNISNFLATDDLPVIEEGEIIDTSCVIQVKFEGHKPVFPEMALPAKDPFLKRN
jgi:hypothetical protein